MENTKTDKIEFAKVMYGMAGNFGAKIEKDDLALRFEILKEHPIDNIKKAGIWLIKNRENTYPPVPTTKEILDAISIISGEIESKIKVEMEADKVLKNLRYFGRECPTKFKDPATQYLMTNRWTFHKLGMMSSKDLYWWRKDFVEAYQAIVTQKPEFIYKIGHKKTEQLVNLVMKKIT